MNNKQQENPPFVISEEAQEKARAAIEQGFGRLSEHIKQIADNFADFNKRREEMRQKRQHGARRTHGRIV